MNSVTIDKDSLDFYKVILFGDYSDPLYAACLRPYRDLNRTLRFEGRKQEDRDQLKEAAVAYIKERIQSLICSDVNSCDAYDTWHKQTCDRLCSMYRVSGVEFHFGQAQKWLNMAVKYTYVIGYSDFANKFPFLHVPIDTYVIDAAKQQLGIGGITVPWSRIDDYSMYIKFQTRLRNKLNVDPLRWEFRAWMNEAVNK